MNSLRLLALLCAVCFGASASAQGCDAYLFPGAVAQVSMATVNAARASIFRDGEGCPDAGESCRGKAYLVQGDKVLTGGAHGVYRCVAFVGASKQTTGWVESKLLTSATVPAPEGDWAGKWKRAQGDAMVTIRKSKDGYTAVAEASYAVSRENVRTGGADGKLVMGSGGIASFGEPGADRSTVCRVQLRQIGPWLLADDGVTEDSNSACGGMGVTLSGVYRRSGAGK